MRTALVRWYRVHRRDLPWRRTRDPWAIWVSESMLQQTRVETVLRYWGPFLRRFPDVEAIARAPIEDVFTCWAGLGYYSRARHLQRAAQEVMRRFDGRIPADVEALRSLPGVGRYTAGAIASIAFDLPAPIVDGNVERVLARWLGLREDVKRPAVAARLWTMAERLAQGREPGTLNQALMELGALRCTPRTPDCARCPISTGCDAHARGDVDALPIRAAKTPVRAIRAAAAWIERGQRVLLVRRPPGGLLGGLWELPGVELARGDEIEPALRAAVLARTGLTIDGIAPLGVVEHLFTHRRLRLSLFRARAQSAPRASDRTLERRWCRSDELDAIAESRLLQKAIARARAGIDGRAALARAPHLRAAGRAG